MNESVEDMSCHRWFLPRLLLLLALVGCASQLHPCDSNIDAAKSGALQEDVGAEGEVESPSEKMRSLDELLLFFPTRFPDGDWEPQNIEFEDVWFETEDGTILHGWFCPCESPRATIVFAHGNAGNLSHRAGMLEVLQTRMQASVLIFDYRGYGRSDGTPTAKGVIEDGRAALAFLLEHTGKNASEIVLLGRSLGGAVAVQLAASSQPRALILESTFSSMRDIAEFHYGKLGWIVPKQKLDSTEHLPRYHGRLLQSHGSVDGTIPISSARKLFGIANEPKRFFTVEGGDHNDFPTEPYLKVLEAFVTSCAGSIELGQ